MDDFNKEIFYGTVWEELDKMEPVVVKKFINIMKNECITYQINGGIHPTVEYILGLAKDQLKEEEENKDEDRDASDIEEDIEDKSFIDPCLSKEQQKQKVRNSWLKRFENNNI